MLVGPLSMVIVNLLLLRFLGLFAAFFNDFDIIVQDGGDDGNHVGLDNTGSDSLRAPNTNVDNALKSKIPLPHAHHVLATALLENAN
jgi:hypothetical protein